MEEDNMNKLINFTRKNRIENEEFEKYYDALWEKTWHRNETQEKYIERILKLIPESFDIQESKKRFNRDAGKSFTKTDLHHSKEEEWRFLEHQGYTDYAVSSDGRVAFRKSGKYCIIEQNDKNSPGYLKLDVDGKYNLDHSIEVYKLIAMGFLGKEFSDGYDVHHIINDGYDCRPSNLILLTRTQHNAVHCIESDKQNYIKKIKKESNSSSKRMKMKEIALNNEKTDSFYNAIWGSNNFEADVYLHNDSCEFQLKNDSIEKTLIDVFEIKDEKLFKEKLFQATSGDGGEDSKILNLRSSSLCSLLFFYNVTKNNPLTLSLNGNNCIFEASVFEFKNKVIRNPSNMDVVLFGKKEDGTKVILFLESKFGEYYFDVTQKDYSYSVPYSYYEKISDLYKKVVSSLDYESDFEKKSKENKSPYFEIIAKHNPSYIGGIKQMISHYLGIQNFVKKEYALENVNARLRTIANYLDEEYAETKLLNCLQENSEIYLAEIVFDNGIDKLRMNNVELTYLNDYEEKHKKLADILNKENENASIHIVNELLHYSDYMEWNHNFENNIIDYYFGKKE